MFNAFHQSNIKRALKNLFTPRKKNVVLIEAHFGLGDNLICLGLIRTLAEKNPNIRYHLACLSQYFHSVSWMLHSSKNVFPTVVTSGREARQLANFLNATYITVGIDNIDIKRFDQSFYEKYGIPFEYRWSKASTPAGPLSACGKSRTRPRRPCCLCKRALCGPAHRPQPDAARTAYSGRPPVRRS